MAGKGKPKVLHAANKSVSSHSATLNTKSSDGQSSSIQQQKIRATSQSTRIQPSNVQLDHLSPLRSASPRPGRQLSLVSSGPRKSVESKTPRQCESETPRQNKGETSGGVTWRTQLSNRSQSLFSARLSQQSARATTPKKDRITAEREAAEVKRKREEEEQKKNERRKNSLRAVLRSADGLYPRRFALVAASCNSVLLGIVVL